MINLIDLQWPGEAPKATNPRLNMEKDETLGDSVRISDIVPEQL